MKKTLLILCALLLTAVGASAQTPYEFHAEDWVTLDEQRVYQTGIAYNDDNTITVTPRTDTNNGGNCNVALGNSAVAAWDNVNGGINTNGYYITSEQTYYVIVGTGLATEDNPTGTGAISSLWWLNGVNANVAPSAPITLDDGQNLFYWDFSENTDVKAKFEDGKMVIDGWTGGGLTATDETATISYIGFCTAEQISKAQSGTFTIPTNTYVHACTANVNVWTLDNSDTEGPLFYVDTAEKNDESGMEPPFLTYWVWQGDEGTGTLPDTKISHETLTNLTAGVYEVSMDIRIIDYDAGTVGSGTTFNATSGSTTVSQDIKLGVNANETTFTDSDVEGTEDDIYGTYTLYVKVEADNGSETGSLTVSLDIKGATYNWIMFKNLKVRLLDESEEIPSGTVSGSLSAAYGTLILPFDVDLSSGSTSTLTAYTGTLNEAKDELTLTAVDGNLTAGVPYIIGGTTGSEYSFSGVPTAYNASYTDGTLTGTLVDMKQENGDFTQDGTQYVLQNHEQGGLAFYPITSDSEGVTLDAYHCYLTLSSGSSPVRGFISLPGSDEATAIVAVESEEEAADAGAIYDLSGRKVSKAVKGVYIQNGKKVLVK